MFSFFSLFLLHKKSFQLLVNLSLENKILWFFSSWLFTIISKITSKALEHFSKYSAPSSFSDLTQMKIFLQLTWWFISSHRMSLISHMGELFFLFSVFKNSPKQHPSCSFFYCCNFGEKQETSMLAEEINEWKCTPNYLLLMIMALYISSLFYFFFECSLIIILNIL